MAKGQANQIRLAQLFLVVTMWSGEVDIERVPEKQEAKHGKNDGSGEAGQSPSLNASIGRKFDPEEQQRRGDRGEHDQHEFCRHG